MISLNNYTTIDIGKIELTLDNVLFIHFLIINIFL